MTDFKKKRLISDFKFLKISSQKNDSDIRAPDIVVYDHGTNIVDNKIQLNVHLMHIRTKRLPIDSGNALTYVEHYHAPLCRAFKILKDEAPDIETESLLSCVVKSVNDIVWPDGPINTLLAHGVLY